MVKKVSIALLSILFLFIIFLLFTTYTISSKQIYPEPIMVSTLSNDRVQVLQKAIQLKTISESEDSLTISEFDSLDELISTHFPLFNLNIKKKKFSDKSLLFEWEGEEGSKKPILLLAHQDVVPVDKEDIDLWKHNPWEGKIEKDTIFGRGTLDDKGGLFAQLEAIEQLLQEGYSPRRTIFLAFGHDEEVGGNRGAKEIAKYFQDMNLQFSYILDEGLYILEGIVPSIEKDVAFIGLAEKGNLTVELSVNISGGHSSIPSDENAIDIISNAVHNLMQNQMPAKLSSPTRAFIDFLGPEMPIFERIVFANSFLFQKLIISIYEKSNTGNAIVRTTTAPTIFRSGTKDNVIPNVANATINFRILPGDSKEEIISHIEKSIKDDRIEIKTIEYNAPSNVSSFTNEAFHTIHQSIKEVYPEVLVSPNLMVGGSDSKHFESLADDVYRFRPFRLNRATITGIHGVNERLAVEDYKKAIAFYKQIIKNN